MDRLIINETKALLQIINKDPIIVGNNYQAWDMVRVMCADSTDDIVEIHENGKVGRFLFYEVYNKRGLVANVQTDIFMDEFEIMFSDCMCVQHIITKFEGYSYV